MSTSQAKAKSSAKARSRVPALQPRFRAAATRVRLSVPAGLEPVLLSGPEPRPALEWAQERAPGRSQEPALLSVRALVQAQALERVLGLAQARP